MNNAMDTKIDVDQESNKAATAGLDDMPTCQRDLGFCLVKIASSSPHKWSSSVFNVSVRKSKKMRFRSSASVAITS